MNRKPYLRLLPVRLLLIILAGLALTCFNGCGKSGAGTPDAGETHIILFHVNDMHAQIDNFAKIAWVIQEEKKSNPQAVVLFFNAGDNFSGNPIVDQYEPKGEPVLQLLNRMNCDVMALGNHEFDYGQEVLKNFITRANFPIICANAVLKGEDGSFPQPKPYTILTTANGLKIAVLALVQVDEYTGVPSSHPGRLKGFTFDPPLETAVKYRHLKNESDIFMALTHLGIETDEELAKRMGELDLIVGGHSHSQISHPTEKEVNGVLIAQAGSNAKYLGRIDLVVKNKQIVKKDGQLIKVADLTNEIPELKEMIAAYNNNPVMEQVIATLPRPVSGMLEVGNLASDGLRKHFNLDIVLHNSGGIRVNHLGPVVKLRDIYSLHPFQNQVVLFNLTTAEIKSLIKTSFEQHKRADLLVSGMHYIIKYTPDMKVVDVELKDEQNRLLDDSKTYKVGLNDYMVSTYPFTHQDPGTSLMVTLNEALIQYLKENQNVCDGIDKLRMLVVEVGNTEKK